MPPPPVTADGQFETADRATRCFEAFRDTGSVEQLEQALLICSPHLHHVARKLTDSTDASDIVHDAFVVAISRADAFASDAKLLPWLLGILRNMARDGHRKRWGRIRGSGESLDEFQAALEPEPGAVVDRREWLRLAEENVARMAEPYRDVMQAHLFRGEAAKQIASRLGRSHSTVRTQIERGLVLLRRALPAPMLFGLAAILAPRTAEAAPPIGLVRARARAKFLLPIAASLSIVAAWVIVPEDPAAATTAYSGGQGPADAVVAQSARSESPEQAEAHKRDAVNVPARSVSLQVTIKLDDGSPAVGVPVILCPRADPVMPTTRGHRTWRTRLTDENGAIMFTDVPPGRTLVRIHDADPGVELTLTETTAASFPIKVHSWLQLRIVDESGQPIPDAEVIASSSLGTHAPGYPVGRSDAAGIVMIAAIAEPTCFWVKADGYVTSLVRQLHAASSREQPLRGDLTMMRGDATCCGYVRDGQGQPVPGALVAACWDAGSPVARLYATTDATGRFEVAGMRPGPWRVAAVAEGLSWSRAKLASSDTTAELTLRPGGSVVGRIEGLSEQDRSDLLVLSRSLAEPRNDPFESVAARLAPDGSFVLQNLRPGRHEVAFFMRNALVFQSQQVIVEDGGQHRIAVGARELRTWLIRVVDAAGKAVPQCLVRMYAATDRSDFWHEARADKAGNVSLPLEPEGEYDIGVFGRNLTGTDRFASVWMRGVRAGALATVVVTNETRQQGAVRGFLQPSVRDFVASGQIMLRGLHESVLVPVAPDGGFRCEDLPPGSYRLEVRQGKGFDVITYPLVEFAVRSGEVVDVGAIGTSGVGHAVLGIEQASQRAPVSVAIRDQAGGRLGHVRVSSDKPVVVALPAGRYELLWVTAGARQRVVPLTIVAGERVEFEIDREKGWRCRFEVTTATPRTPCQVDGQLVRLDSNRGVGLQFVPETKDGPRIAEVDLLPGQYSLTVQSPWGTSGGAQFTVPADVQAPLRIQVTIR